MKQVLFYGQDSKTRKFFIMGNKGRLPNTPFFDTMKECMIAIFKLSIIDKQKYTNIYDMSEGQYTKWIKG